MNNVVSLKAYRTMKEAHKLFHGYRMNVYKMDRTTLMAELDRYRKEAANYPHHLLTLVKGEILMGVLKKVSVTKELGDFAAREEVRLNKEIEKRLYEDWSSIKRE